MKKKISILGSTGSIGTNTLEVLDHKLYSFDINTFVANSNFKKIIHQIKKYKPNYFVIINKNTYLKVKKKFLKSKTIFFNKISDLPLKGKINFITISAIPGLAGLHPTMEFTKKSKEILLANKEAVICGWDILKKIAKKNKTKITPIDSEHFSIMKLLQGSKNIEIDKIYITASGGPFLKLPLSKFNGIKPVEALRHPKWSMGKKISIDSSTLMNKILELIEAQKIFPFCKKKYEIIIHPQSLVHAIVKFKNGITRLLYHEPDMKVPIANAIFKTNLDIKDLFFSKNDNLKNLEFVKIDPRRYPIIKIIPKLNKFISTPIILNAANEILVDHFLKRKISFNSISSSLFIVLNDKNYRKYAIKNPLNLKTINIIDEWARETTLNIIKKNKKLR
ncbi:MAG: 1-deoxy-D-xylulose-5-phosphate reductoisomerase [Pelagibacteraceae bacterium]